jgi:tRNA(fMet)-specific endonuclease VapC
MAHQVVLLDTNILIDYFRKSIKSNSLLSLLIKDDYEFSISVITHFEILRGITKPQEEFWWTLLKDIEVISYFPAINYTAIQIQKQLKIQRKTINIEDLIIAATAVHLELPLATLNKKHFQKY